MVVRDLKDGCSYFICFKWKAGKWFEWGQFNQLNGSLLTGFGLKRGERKLRQLLWAPRRSPLLVRHTIRDLPLMSPGIPICPIPIPGLLCAPHRVLAEPLTSRIFRFSYILSVSFRMSKSKNIFPPGKKIFSVRNYSEKSKIGTRSNKSWSSFR